MDGHSTPNPYVLNVTNEGSQAATVIPCLGFGDFDRYGKLFKACWAEITAL
jgi:hypothetical protein